MKVSRAVVFGLGLMVAGLCGAELVPRALADEAATAPGGQQKAASVPDKQVDQVVAKVNGTTISQAQLDQELVGIQRRLARQGQPMPDGAMGQIRGKVLDQMIGQELLLQESRKQKISVDEQKIQDQLKEMAQSFDDPAAFDLALIGAGLSREILSERLRQQFAIRQLVDAKVVAGIEVGDASADEFYKGNPDYFVEPEQVRARHILIRTGDKADDAAKAAARKQMEDIHKQATGGGDFAALAKAHSQDPGSKENGGDLGFFARGQMVKPFEEAAFALAINGISPIVETQFGYHLIQVTERKEVSAVAFEKAKPRILEHLKQQAVREKLDAYVDVLRQAAKIEKFI